MKLGDLYYVGHPYAVLGPLRVLQSFHGPRIGDAHDLVEAEAHLLHLTGLEFSLLLDGLLHAPLPDQLDVVISCYGTLFPGEIMRPIVEERGLPLRVRFAAPLAPRPNHAAFGGRQVHKDLERLVGPPGLAIESVPQLLSWLLCIHSNHPTRFRGNS